MDTIRGLYLQSSRSLWADFPNTNRTRQSFTEWREVPQTTWGETIHTIVYLNNGSPSALDKSATSKEAWMGEMSEPGPIRPFGCTADAYNNNPKRGKLDGRSIKCKLLGYE